MTFNFHGNVDMKISDLFKGSIHEKKMGKVGLLDQPADPPPPPRKLVHLKGKKNFDVYFAF